MLHLRDVQYLDLKEAERLHALRALDIFHRWESIDEGRLGRRCGEIITGRQIRILGDLASERPEHLECPTDGCLSVPFDWIALDPSDESEPDKSMESVPLGRDAKKGYTMHRPSVFGFLRAPLAFF